MMTILYNEVTAFIHNINGPLAAVVAAHKLLNAILAKILPLPLCYAKKAILHAIFTIVEHKG